MRDIFKGTRARNPAASRQCLLMTLLAVNQYSLAISLRLLAAFFFGSPSDFLRISRLHGESFFLGLLSLDRTHLYHHSILYYVAKNWFWNSQIAGDSKIFYFLPSSLITKRRIAKGVFSLALYWNCYLYNIKIFTYKIEF